MPAHVAAFAKPLVFDVARIAVGKKVFSSTCQLSLEATGKLNLRYNLLKNHEPGHPILIEPEFLTELKYFMAEEDIALRKKPSLSGGDSSDDGDEISFLAMRVHPVESTGLKHFSNSYCQVESESKTEENKKYIVVEFRSDDDLRALLDAMGDTPLATFANSASKLTRFQTASYSRTLIEKNEKDRKQRLSSLSGTTNKRRNEFLASRKDKETLLVYPFPVKGADLREAVKDLTELKRFSGNQSEGIDSNDDDEEKLDDMIKPTSSDEAENQNKAASVRGRGHYVTIGVDDYCRLEAPEFFNDTLIDFWMQWYVAGSYTK